MKTSFIATVFNEEKTIKKLLDSLTLQTLLPDEVVITDAGSTDKTLSEILEFQRSHRKLKMKILSMRGNRSTGRNESIRNSTGDIIVATDAGCTLHKDWIKNITKPFSENDADVVAGYYHPVVKNVFEKSLAAYTSVMPDKLDASNFLPSSRSVAFRKIAWEKAGGYPEELDYCEDLIFAKNLKRKNFKFYFVQDALVYWRQRKNFKEAFFQFLNYARGDGFAHYFRPSTPFLFLRYIIGIALVVMTLVTNSFFLFFIILLALFAYIIWAIVKNYKYVNDSKAIFILPALQFVSDIAVLSGTSIGYLNSIWNTKKT